MGILSLTTIILSLACLAIMVGLVLAVILLWPQKIHDRPEDQINEPSQTERPPSDQD